MKRSGFKQKLTVPLKRSPFKHKVPLKGQKQGKVKSKKVKVKKTARAKKTALRRQIIEQYQLPDLLCSRYGMGKNPTRQDILKGLLWRVFSRFIRARDKYCISCLLEKILQAGHYAPAGGNDLELLFSEFNVNGECEGCNGFDSFHLVPMRKNLIAKYGIEKVEELDLQKSQKKAIKWEETVYVEKIKYYYNELQKCR